MTAKTKKHINLLPKEDFDKTTLGRILKWSLSTFRYIVILVELIVVGGFLSRFYFDVRINDLNDAIKQQSAIIAARRDFENEFREKQLKVSVLSAIDQTSTSLVAVTDAIASYIPLDTRIENISLESGNVVLRVSSARETSIYDLINLMSGDTLFDTVTLGNVEQKADSPFLFFTIHANVNTTNG